MPADKPATPTAWTKCPECKGSGTVATVPDGSCAVEETTCPRCDGKGKVAAESKPEGEG